MQLISVNLRAEAAAEARRLAAGRARLRDGDQRALLLLEGGGAWIAFPRRARRRRALAGRVCLVWRVSLEDASGRSVESRLVSLLIDSRADIRLVLADAASDALIRARINVEASAWRDEAVAVTAAFATARLSREREIAERTPPVSSPSQPGLFDRRAERSRQAVAAALAAARQALLERQHAAEEAAAVALGRARLLLVLVS